MNRLDSTILYLFFSGLLVMLFSNASLDIIADMEKIQTYHASTTLLKQAIKDAMIMASIITVALIMGLYSALNNWHKIAFFMAIGLLFTASIYYLVIDAVSVFMLFATVLLVVSTVAVLRILIGQKNVFLFALMLAFNLAYLAEFYGDETLFIMMDNVLFSVAIAFLFQPILSTCEIKLDEREGISAWRKIEQKHSL